MSRGTVGPLSEVVLGRLLGTSRRFPGRLSWHGASFLGSVVASAEVPATLWDLSLYRLRTSPQTRTGTMLGSSAAGRSREDRTPSSAVFSASFEEAP
jgi:hypothetical protein